MVKDEMTVRQADTPASCGERANIAVMGGAAVSGTVMIIKSQEADEIGKD